MPSFEFNIIRHIGVLSERSSGWSRELNLISWNGGEPKYDIRDWSPDHEKMGKGIALSREELMALCDLAGAIDEAPEKPGLFDDLAAEVMEDLR